MYNYRNQEFRTPNFSQVNQNIYSKYNTNKSYRKKNYNKGNFQPIASAYYNKNNTNYQQKINHTQPFYTQNINNSELHSKNESDKNSSGKGNENINGMFQLNPNEPLCEIFGLKIFLDDVLIICILIFLYQEGIQDEYLFISLILLLLS